MCAYVCIGSESKCSSNFYLNIWHFMCIIRDGGVVPFVQVHEHSCSAGARMKQCTLSFFIMNCPSFSRSLSNIVLFERQSDAKRNREGYRWTIVHKLLYYMSKSDKMKTIGNKNSKTRINACCIKSNNNKNRNIYVCSCVNNVKARVQHQQKVHLVTQ